MAMHRRAFLQRVAVGTAAAAVPGQAFAAGETIVVAVMGANTRGRQLIDDIVRVPGMEIGAIIDVDEKIAAATAKKLEDVGRRAPTIGRDIRRTVADKGIDAVVIAAPTHWHGPAAILAHLGRRLGRLRGGRCSSGRRRGGLVRAAASGTRGLSAGGILRRRRRR